jgi:hypothetical protein
MPIDIALYLGIDLTFGVFESLLYFLLVLIELDEASVFRPRLWQCGNCLEAD